MKKEYYSTLIASMMIVALVTPCLHGENVAHDVSENDNAMAISPSEDETYAMIWEEYDRLIDVRPALWEEYEHSLLVKYASLNLTREERHQRIRELKEGNVEERRKAKELDDFDIALSNAEGAERALLNFPQRGAGGDIRVAPNTKEYQEFERTVQELGIIVDRKWDALVDIRDGEIRIAPDTQEHRKLRGEFEKLAGLPEPTDEETERMGQVAEKIHQIAKTNTPTSVFQIPSGVIERRQEYNRRWQEKLTQWREEQREKRQEQRKENTP